MAYFSPPLFLFLGFLAYLFPDVTEAVLVVWLIVVMRRL